MPRVVLITCCVQVIRRSSTLGTQRITRRLTLDPGGQPVKFKLATLTYRCLNCTAPRYLSAPLRRVADYPFFRHLHSSFNDALLVRPTQFITSSGRAFPVAAGKLSNELPADNTATSSLNVLRCRLEAFLFRLLYSKIILISSYPFTGKHFRNGSSLTMTWTLFCKTHIERT